MAIMKVKAGTRSCMAEHRVGELSATPLNISVCATQLQQTQKKIQADHYGPY